MFQGQNAVIHYEIVSGQEIFAVNDNTGEVTVKDSTALDRELQDNFTVLVGRDILPYLSIYAKHFNA